MTREKVRIQTLCEHNNNHEVASLNLEEAAVESGRFPSEICREGEIFLRVGKVIGDALHALTWDYGWKWEVKKM